MLFRSILPPVTEESGSASEPSQVTKLVPSSVLPVSDSPDIAVISELGDREDRVDSPTSADLVPSQRIQLPTNSVPDSSPSPLSDIVPDLFVWVFVFFRKLSSSSLFCA